MRILIFSDVHIGTPYFKYADNLFKLLNKPWDLIITDGDLYELLGFKTKKQIETEYAKIFDILNSSKTIKICGNHDLSCGVDSYKLTLPNGKNIQILHGHQYCEKTGSCQVKFNIICYNLFKFEPRLLLKPFKSYAESENKLIQEYKTKCDILILAHSHDPWYKKVENLDVFNVGDIIEHFSYIEINDNEVFLRHGLQN